MKWTKQLWTPGSVGFVSNSSALSISYNIYVLWYFHKTECLMWVKRVGHCKCRVLLEAACRSSKGSYSWGILVVGAFSWRYFAEWKFGCLGADNIRIVGVLRFLAGCLLEGHHLSFFAIFVCFNRTEKIAVSILALSILFSYGVISYKSFSVIATYI